MKPIGIVLLVIAIILVAAMIVLYFLGKKAQKKKEEQDEQMKAAAQTVTMLIIDKKRMKMKDAGLPSQVMEQANKLMQRAKLPIVKAKVGPRVMTLIADEQIYDDIPVKKEVKATVSGLYITGVRGLRGPLEKPVKKKKGFRAKLQEKYNEANARLKESKSGSSSKKKNVFTGKNRKRLIFPTGKISLFFSCRFYTVVPQIMILPSETAAYFFPEPLQYF